MMLSNLSQQNAPLKVRITSEASISHSYSDPREFIWFSQLKCQHQTLLFDLHAERTQSVSRSLAAGSSWIRAVKVAGREKKTQRGKKRHKVLMCVYKKTFSLSSSSG